MSTQIVLNDNTSPVVVTQPKRTPAIVATQRHTSETSGADLTYVHTQASPSATWTVNHGLAKFPAVSVVDSGGSVVYGELEYLDANSVRLTFSAAFSGTAYCN